MFVTLLFVKEKDLEGQINVRTSRSFVLNVELFIRNPCFNRIDLHIFFKLISPRVAVRGMRGKVGASPHPVAIPGGHSSNTGTDSLKKTGLVNEADD